MALNPRDLPSDKKAAEITKLYARAQRDIGLHVQRAVYAGLTATARNRRLQAAAILAYLDQLGAQTDPLLRDLARQAIADGDALAEADVRRLGATLTASSAEFYAVNQEAVTAVEEAMRGRLDDARRTVGRSVNDVFRKATLEGTQRALLGVEGSPQKAARRLAQDLADRGQVGFRDKSGRMWKLKDYAEMATRTTTREAVVHGQVNRLLAHNISLVRISEHADSCPQCAPYQGRLIDLSGQITEWQGEAVASGPLPPLHPRCRHTIGGVSVRVEAVRQQLLGAA